VRRILKPSKDAPEYEVVVIDGVSIQRLPEGDSVRFWLHTAGLNGQVSAGLPENPGWDQDIVPLYVPWVYKRWDQYPTRYYVPMSR
jgi:hypothetical protein